MRSSCSLAGIVSGAVVGLVIFLVVFLPLDGRRNFDLRTLIATLALALVGENLLLDQFGPQPQAFPEIFSRLPTHRHRRARTSRPISWAPCSRRSSS